MISKREPLVYYR